MYNAALIGKASGFFMCSNINSAPSLLSIYLSSPNSPLFSSSNVLYEFISPFFVLECWLPFSDLDLRLTHGNNMPLATPWGCQQGSINHGEVPYLVEMACRHSAEGQGCLQPIEPNTKGLALLFVCLHLSNLIQKVLAGCFNTIWYYFWSSAYQASFVITAGGR